MYLINSVDQSVGQDSTEVTFTLPTQLSQVRFEHLTAKTLSLGTYRSKICSMSAHWEKELNETHFLVKNYWPIV